MKPVTTMMSSIEQDRKEILTGKERYPIIGDRVPEDKVHQILESYAGLNKYWDCYEKAFRARDIIGEGIVAVGSLMVTSATLTSEYGYYYNPPYEFHAWLLLLDFKTEVLYGFDAALPGVIEKGLTICDEIGPALTGRNPVVLAGEPTSWMRYKAEEFHVERR